MSKKLFTQKDIIQLTKLFTKEDLALAKWLRTCPHELIEILLNVLRKQFTNSVITDCFLLDHQLIEKHSKVKNKLRPNLSILLVYELKRYSAHSFHFLSGKPGYEKILTNILKKNSKQQGQTFNNSIMTIAEKENLLTDLILNEGAHKSSFENQNILNKSVALLFKAALKKLTPQLFKRFTPTLSWALFAKDLYDLGDEAARVTAPFVINIAIYRTLKRKKC